MLSLLDSQERRQVPLREICFFFMPVNVGFHALRALCACLVFSSQKRGLDALELEL